MTVTRDTRKRTAFPQPRRKADETLVFVGGRLREALKFSGHSQVDVLLSVELVETLGNPPQVFARFDSTQSAVLLRGVWEGGHKIRRTAWSRIVSAPDLARLLYRLDPQGRYFDASVTGEREVVIGARDVIARYSYHRFEPANPLLSPSRARQAGEEFDRTGKVPKPQYQSEVAPAPGEWPSGGDAKTVPQTVQTTPPTSPPTSQLSTTSWTPATLTEPDPRDYDLEFDSWASYVAWRRGLSDAGEEHTLTPDEARYVRAVRAYKDSTQNENQSSENA
jgi:hypothetical protein